MTFLIIYRDPRHANNEGIALGSNEPVRQAIDRLRREGYDVTLITRAAHRPAILEKSIEEKPVRAWEGHQAAEVAYP